MESSRLTETALRLPAIKRIDENICIAGSTPATLTKIAYNGLHIAEGGDYEALTFKIAQMFNRSTTVHFSTKPATFGNMLLCAVFLHKSIIKWIKISLVTYG